MEALPGASGRGRSGMSLNQIVSTFGNVDTRQKR